MNETLPNVVAKLSADLEYIAAFNEAYGAPPNADDLARAIASFERAIQVAPTPFERFQSGDATALNASQIRGRDLFFSRATGCARCHAGPNFSDQRFHNLGVGINNVAPDLGRFNVTGVQADRGAFKTPTLLNVAKTSPYMHDGSLPNLAAVVQFYNQGGVPNAQLARGIRPLGLNATQQADLVAFLEALSADDNLSSLPRFD